MVEENPDIIGITSGMTHWYPGVFKVIEITKKFFRNVPTILGGIYATLCSEHAKRHSSVDIVFNGRDELEALKLISNLTNFELRTPNSLPVEAAADQGLVEAAASQISTMRQISVVPDIEPDIVGLKIPEYKLAVKFTSGTQRKAEIGVVTPTNSGYYVRNEDGMVVIITKDSVDAILNLAYDDIRRGRFGLYLAQHDHGELIDQFEQLPDSGRG